MQKTVPISEMRSRRSKADRAGTSDRDALIRALRNPRLSAGQRDELIERGLKDSQCFVRRVAVEALALVECRSAVRRLIQTLSDRCWEVRVAALEGLECSLQGRRRSPRVMFSLLRDPSKLVRLQAAEALGVIGDPAARTPLRLAIEDPSPLVRRYVAEALGRVGSKKDAALIARRLQRERSESAKLGLWHGAYLLGQREALSELLHLLNSKSYTIRSATAVALEDAVVDRAAQFVSRALRKALKKETTVARELMAKTLRLFASSR
jgi:HEAT repeat protein